MTDWKIGDHCRVWRSGWVGEHEAGGYEYGTIETIEDVASMCSCTTLPFHSERCGPQLVDDAEVMLVGDDGREIYAQVKDLEEGE